MAAVRLSDAGNALITKAPPWSSKLFKFGRLAYAPGHTPPHLQRYQAGFTSAQAECRRQNSGKHGVAYVEGVMSCVSSKLAGRK